MNDKNIVHVDEGGPKTSEMAAYISSSDSSISVVPPSIEGGGYVLGAAVTYPSTTSVTTVTAGTPPVITPSLVSNLLNGQSNTNATMTVTGSSPFNLSANWSAFISLSRVIVVGGVLGKLSASSTVLSAVTTYATQLATATSTAPWVLLIMPGTYSGETVTIPSNVYLIAYEPGSVTMSDTISYTALSTDPVSVQYVTGINFNGGSLTFNTTAKPTNGVNSSLVIQHCGLSGTFSANMRPNGLAGDNNDYYKDNVWLLDCTISGTAAYLGGITNMRECTVTGASTIGGATATIVQVLNGTFAPTTLTISTTFLLSIHGSILGGTWTAPNASTTIILDTVQADSTAYATPWTLNGTTANIYIYGTYLPYTLNRTSTTAWTLTFPNLTGTSPTDKPCRFTLLNPPLGTNTLTVTVPSYVSPFSASDGTGTNYVVPPISMVQLSGVTSSQVSVSSTTSSLVIVANVSLLGGDDRVCVDVNPPPHVGPAWYI